MMISSTMARDFTVSVFQPVAVFSFFGFYWDLNIFLVQYNYSIENWVWLGLELQWFLLMHGAAWPPLFIGVLPPQLPFPKQGGLN